ncbi:hypothetical protein ElyMa_003915300 [Elysia marginata]|uniref:Uncharacterized protein n=1 Tax=Elysia marginata TaxID=1093978 RepID=A0AAV4FR95_9GAST|nr:hypothetical protein ElyMa_003915300 [Elysia marginata]
MPRCRRDQRGFAICLVVMVTVETFAIFTVMHLEHLAAEENAEQRRADLREDRESDESSDELEELSLEEEWAENLVRKKRALSRQRIGENHKLPEGIPLTGDIDSMHNELFGSKYGENPKIKNVLMLKDLVAPENSANDESWLAEPLPQANKRVFIIKDTQNQKSQHDKPITAKRTHKRVQLNERSRAAHTGSRKKPEVVNLYRDMTSL